MRNVTEDISQPVLSVRDMLPQKDERHKGEAPRLVVDAMLGRLARWLRLMGFDTEYWRTGSDEALMRHARETGRLIVTRDHPLAGRRGVQALLIKAETLDEQIAEIRSVLGALAGAAPFSRCPECNGVLVELPRAEAKGRVPPYVWHTQTQFRRCPDCQRIYWKGTHYPGLLARLEDDRDG